MSAGWTYIKRNYGLERPYNFRVAIAFLLNVLAVAAVLVVCFGLTLEENLSIGTDRFYFFIYIVVVLSVGAIFSRVRAIALIAFFWSATELGLALSTTVLQHYRVLLSLLPKDTTSQIVTSSSSDSGYVFHPLLQTALKPNWKYKGALWRAREPGIIVHNSLGLRGTEPTDDDLKRPLIFVYGGSTTYDISVTQGETWVEQLQRNLGQKFTVLNFGVTGYSTTQHVVQTAFYQEVNGKRPVCAIYYVGWNDIYNAHVPSLDLAYADWEVLLQAVRKREPFLASYSPIVKFLSNTMRARFDSIPLPKNYFKARVVGSDSRLEYIYREHINTILAINSDRHVRSIFIAQMLNTSEYASSALTPPFVDNKDLWSLEHKFNLIAKDTVERHGAEYIDPGVDNFRNEDFTDMGHFSASGASKLANLIAERVRGYCQ